jgi:hypothetical protein
MRSHLICACDIFKETNKMLLFLVEWLPLAEMVLIPATDNEKGLTVEGVKAESLTTTQRRFFSRFPTADSCCNATDSSIDWLK